MYEIRQCIAVFDIVGGVGGDGSGWAIAVAVVLLGGDDVSIITSITNITIIMTVIVSTYMLNFFLIVL